MVVLLTGAAGFIGSHLARLMVEDGCEVHAILRPSTDTWRINDLMPHLRVIPCDLADSAELSRRLQNMRIDLCVHSAWYAKPGAYLRARENLVFLDSSLRLFTLMADGGCKRFVGLGSVLEYDSRAGYLSEDSPTEPESLYGACKLAFKNLAEKLILSGDMTFVWPRVFNLFGPGENRARLLPDVIIGLLAGQRVKLTPGEQIMDFLHVKDVATAIWSVARSPLTGAVNIGSAKPVEVKTLVLTAASLIGRSELLDFGAIPYNPLSPSFVCANNRRLREGTGWRPKFTLDAGVQDTVEWWRGKL